MIIRRGVQYRKIDLNLYPNGLLEVQAITLSTGASAECSVLNLYNPSKNITLSELRHYLLQLGQRFIIVGDFNAHSQLLDSSCIRSNMTGRTLEDILTNDRVCLVNPVNFFTYLDSRTGKRSCLDLCLVSPNLISSTEIALSSDVGSDHCAVQVVSGVSPIINESICQKKWIFTSESLKRFSEKIKQSNLDKPNTVDEICYDMEKRIIESAAECISKTSGTYRTKKRTPWWNNECSRAVAERRQARRTLERHPNRLNMEIYRQKSENAKRICKESKRNSWKRYVSQLKFDTPMSEVWNIYKAIKSQYVPHSYPVIDNGEIISDPLKKADMFAEHFINNGKMGRITNKNTVETINRNSLKDMTDESDYNCDLTMEELNLAIKNSKDTSPGEDDITYRMIKALPADHKEDILQLMNQSFHTGTVPTNWKIGIIIPILKPGKNKENVESYRPIALLSCLGKLLERIIQRRLDYQIENRLQLLARSQCGFRKGQGTIDVLVRLEQEIRESMRDRKVCLVVYMDLKSAYDKVWGRGLVYKLIKSGLKGKIVQWLNDYLRNRKIKVKIEGMISENRGIETGVPQGAVLSPILFNVMINDIPQQEGIVQYIYADDITISCSGESIIQIEKDMQTYLTKFNHWCDCWGIVVNSSKTRMQHFTNKRVNCPQIIFKNEMVQYTKTQKILGLIFDSPKLKWKEHINYLKTESLRRMNIMKAVYSTNWGADKKVLRLFYIAYIRSKIDYGSMLYSSATETLLNKLEVVQNACLRMILGARRSTPILSLQAEAYITPLNLRRKYLSSKCYIKLMHRPREDQTARSINIRSGPSSNLMEAPVGSFARNSRMFLDAIGIEYLKRTETTIVSKIPPWKSVKSKVILNEENESKIINDTTFQDYIENLFYGYTHIYTDGSKTSLPTKSTASGMYLPHLERATCWRLNPNHSVISAELYAICKALEYIKQNIDGNCIIFSDAKSALQIVENPGTSYLGVVDEIIELMLELNNSRKVVLHWVRAHIGIKGNEIADKTANLGHEALTSALYPLAREEEISLVKEKFKQYWDQHWKDSTYDTGKGLFLRNIKDNIHHESPINFKNRRMDVVFHRLRMGHVGVGSYLHRFNMRDSNTCQNCNETETIEHFLMVCPAYRTQRQRMLNKLRNLNVENITMKLMLGGSDASRAHNKKYVRITAEFIRDSGRLDEL
uniref:Pol-like protein n=2 Tax=Hirondellea gigas TaxID=1518452 RepID=A0A2P2I2N0_9CRUS